MDILLERPLNRLLKMAVLAGVETAVRMHVRRGDDLDARDGDGMTPLMLAASKNKAGICTLLLSSGADAFLTDPTGRNALDIAKASGASEAVAVLGSREWKASEAPGVPADPSFPAAQTGGSPDAVPEAGSEVKTHSPLALDAGSIEGDSLQDLSGWEPEEDGPPPKGDKTLAVAASAVHRAISGHRPIDTAEDWEDFEAFLPDHATPLTRAGDEEGRDRIRDLLRLALREGSVPEYEVVALCESDDGSLNPEGEALLGLVLGDLGAETDERTEAGRAAAGGDEDGSDAREEAEISEALAFLDDLGSGRNEPLRIYVREMSRRRLLKAEEELVLGRDIEEGAASALDALASWPEGVAAVLAAADRVRSGDAEAEEISTGGVPEPSEDGGEESAAELEESETSEGDGSPDEAVMLTAAAGKFVDRAAEIARLARYAGKGGAGEKALREALAAANLTRSFLMALANAGNPVGNVAAGRFAKSVARHAAARERLAVSNLRLALSIAKRYQGMGLPLDDLVQEGNIGLLKAVDRYDWRKGFRFSTYATWWIRQQVSRAVADKGKTIRTPVHVHDFMFKMAREAGEMERTTGRRPSAAALAERLSISEKVIAALLVRAEEPVSLHEPDSKGIAPAENLPDLAAADPFEAAARKELVLVIEGVLAGLDQRSAEVIARRYGLGGSDSHTLEETGEHFGVTRERIRQIEAKAFRKLAKPARSGILLDFLDSVPRKKFEEDGAGTLATEETGETELQELLPDRILREETASENSGLLSPVVYERTSSRGTDRVVAMALEIGARVEDGRGTGGDVVILLPGGKDAKVRRVARALVSTGFVFCPGIGFRI